MFSLELARLVELLDDLRSTDEHTLQAVAAQHQESVRRCSLTIRPLPAPGMALCRSRFALHAPTAVAIRNRL
jgi:hypothetical protein